METSRSDYGGSNGNGKSNQSVFTHVASIHLNLIKNSVKHASAEIFNSKNQLNEDSYLGKT